MKVASVIFMYYPYYGGAENQARLLARAFQRFGHEVMIITMHFGRTAHSETLDEIPVVRVPDRAVERGRITGIVRAGIAAFRQLRRLQGLDIVHMHGVPFLLIPAVCFKMLYGIPVVVKMTSGGVTARSTILMTSRLSWLNWLKRWFLRRVDCFVCLNDELAAEVEGLVADARRVLIPNGVDCDHWKPAKSLLEYKAAIGLDGYKSAVYVGRIGEAKGVDVLLNVWREVVRRIPEAKLFIVGDGPSSDDMRNLAATLGISELVRFVGPKEDIREILFAMDVFLLFSPNEGMSNALLEAMAAGVPVVCSDNPGNSALIQHMVNGLRVAAGAGLIPDAAEHVCRVLENTGLAMSLAARARADVLEKFDISVTARQYEQLFLQLTKE